MQVVDQSESLRILRTRCVLLLPRWASLALLEKQTQHNNRLRPNWATFASALLFFQHTCIAHCAQGLEIFERAESRGSYLIRHIARDCLFSLGLALLSLTQTSDLERYSQVAKSQPARKGAYHNVGVFCGKVACIPGLENPRNDRVCVRLLVIDSPT